MTTPTVSGQSNDHAHKQSLVQPTAQSSPANDSTVVDAALFDSIPGAIAQLITGPEGQRLSCPFMNAGCYRLMEIPVSSSVAERLAASEPACQNVFDCIHADDLSHFEMGLSRMAKAPHLWEWEGRVILPSGKVKWIFITMQPTVNHTKVAPAEGITHWQALIQETTPYKQSEIEAKQLNQALTVSLEMRTAELAQSQTRLQHLADNVPDMLYEMTLSSEGEASFHYVSSACHKLLNLAPAQLRSRGKDILQLVHPDDRTDLQSAIQNAALIMRVCQHEFRVVLPSGRQRWVRTIAKPVPQSDGTIIWYGSLSDIGDRKQIESKLQDSLKELADVKFALDCSSNVAITDHRGHITYVNDKFCEISKYSRAELMGSTHRLINSGYHPREFFEDMWYTISNGHVWLGEMRNQDKHGNLYWEDTTIVPFLDKDGCPYQYVAIRNDITERKRAEICLVQQAEDLEQALSNLQQAQTQLVQTEKMSSLGQLVAGVAHEINNPVNFIYGNVNPANRYIDSLIELLSLYQTHYPNPPEEIANELEDIDVDFVTEDLPKLITSMKVGADRIRQIVASLRTFSRKDEAEKKAVDIHQGIDSTLMILAHRLKAQQDRAAIKVVKQYGELSNVLCYAGQLNQVFMNILSNAIDALEDVDAPQLTLSTRVDGNQAVIALADNGMGMPEAVRSQIFNPFYTTKPIGQGTGMGLSISYQIVTERHGGSLSVTSTPGEGTVFTIQIPI